MRNYIILNNQRSDEISGLIIQELAPISKPLQRTQVETIDGRDGDIVTPLGYAAYNKKIKIGLYSTFDINEIIAYFATQGTAIFSNEPDKYYNYQILDQIDYERLVRYRVATVTMHVQPFKYSATEGTITVDASDTVSGEGSDIALDGTAEAPFNVLRHKGNATQKILNGINLIDIVAHTGTDGGISWTITESTIIGSGTASGATSFPNTDWTPFPQTLPIGTYTFSIPQAISCDIDLVTRNSNNQQYNTAIIPAGQTSITVNQPRDMVDFRLALVYMTTGQSVSVNIPNKLQFEAGDLVSDFEPYVGGIPSPNPDYPQDMQVVTGDSTITIDDGDSASQTYVIPLGDNYLAKIGDYADEPVKVDGTWYIRRAIGKVAAADFNNSSNLSGGGVRYYTPNEYGGKSSTQEVLTMSSHFIGCSHADRGAALNTAYVNGNIGVSMDTTMTLNQFKTWFANNNVDLYYVLATPTDEAITDQDLIDALDEFYGQAHSYKGRTHLTATPQGDNAPAVLAVEVGEDNESTVTNAGNTTSRPILTIYGQGDIGVYINDVEVLDIELGDEGYITLDSVEMEAYKDNTANLKNRLVTGDYSKLALNAGANKIRFTGTVTKYEISKYSRWL